MNSDNNFKDSPKPDPEKKFTPPVVKIIKIDTGLDGSEIFAQWSGCPTSY